MRFLRTRPVIAGGIAILLLALNVAIFYALKEEERQVLTVSFLDVGQGDAIFIEGPDGVEVLIDGGRDRSVVRELPKVTGWLDRTIDLVVATHPDADHVGGLPEVFARYRVSSYLYAGVEHETPQTARLAASVAGEEGLTSARARRGMRIHLGKDAYADVLYPDRDVTNIESNAGSVVLRVVYGETSFLLTGDAPGEIEEYLVVQGDVASDVLKAGHHGSRTSTSPLFLRAVAPDTVIISAGKDNSYGHPHAEVVERINERGAALLSTAEEGTMTFVSDGVHIVRDR